MRAKKWLRMKVVIDDENVKSMFLIRPEEGGFAGSLCGEGFIRREDDTYILTGKGRRWLGYKLR